MQFKACCFELTLREFSMVLVGIFGQYSQFHEELGYQMLVVVILVLKELDG